MAQRRIAAKKLEHVNWTYAHGQGLLQRGLEPMDVDEISPRSCIQYTSAVGAMIVDEVASVADNVSRTVVYPSYIN